MKIYLLDYATLQHRRISNLDHLISTGRDLITSDLPPHMENYWRHMVKQAEIIKDYLPERLNGTIKVVRKLPNKLEGKEYFYDDYEVKVCGDLDSQTIYIHPLKFDFRKPRADKDKLGKLISGKI